MLGEQTLPETDALHTPPMLMEAWYHPGLGLARCPTPTVITGLSFGSESDKLKIGINF